MAEETLGARLRRLRLEQGRANGRPRGTPLADAAEAAGISRAHLNKIELDEDNPSLPVLRRLARSYGVTLNDLEGAPQPKGAHLPDEGHHGADDIAWSTLLAGILDLRSEAQLAVVEAVRRIILDETKRDAKGRGAGTEGKAGRRR